MNRADRGVPRRGFLQILAASLVAGLDGCRSESLENPPMTETTETTTTSAGAQPPLVSLDPFRLDEHMMGGALQATEPGPHSSVLEIHEWMTWLRVRSDERVGVLVVTRRDGDLPGQPVGLFRRQLDERQLIALQQGIESIKWSSLPALRGGDILANHFAIEYTRGDLLIQRGFNARNRDFIAAISPYMDAVAVIMNAIAERPVGIVQVSVAIAPDGADPNHRRLTLVIENPGSGAIVLTDPRVPRSAQAKGAQTYLRVAPANDGWSEPSWTNLPLPALPEGNPKTLVLPAGGRLELVVPWQAPAAGSYYLQGAWIDYAGPIEPAPNQLPLIPLPQDGPVPTIDGPYPVRGAAFAMGVGFAIEPTKPR